MYYLDFSFPNHKGIDYGTVNDIVNFISDDIGKVHSFNTFFNELSDPQKYKTISIEISSNLSDVGIARMTKFVEKLGACHIKVLKTIYESDINV